MSDVANLLQRGTLGTIALGAGEAEVQRAWGPPVMWSRPRTKARVRIWSFHAVEVTLQGAGVVSMLTIYPAREHWPDALHELRDRRGELAGRAALTSLCAQFGVPVEAVPLLTFEDQFGDRAGSHVMFVGCASTGTVEKLSICV